MLNIDGRELDSAVEQLWCLYDVAGRGCQDTQDTLEKEGGLGGMWMRLYRYGLHDNPVYKHEKLDAVYSEFRALLRQKSTMFIPGNR